MIRISNDDTRLDPPAVVATGPHRIPHTRHARADLDPIAISDATRILTDRGHSNPRQHRDHRIISASLRAAVLALWKM